MYELRVTNQGRFVREGSGFSLVQEPNEIVEQYLRVGLRDSIIREPLTSYREADIEDEERFAVVQQEISSDIITRIANSFVGDKIEPSRLSVEVKRKGKGQLGITLGYVMGTGQEVSSSVIIEEGKIKIDETFDRPFILPYEIDLIEEELVVADSAERIEVSVTPQSELWISTNPDSFETRIIRGYPLKIKQENRVVYKNVNIPGIGPVDEIGSYMGASIRIKDGTGDSIMLSTLYRNVNQDMKVLNVEPLTGNIAFVERIPELDDWLIEYKVSSDGENIVELNITEAEIISTARELSLADISDFTSIEEYPAQFEEVRSPKVFIPDKVLGPGVYTLLYYGRVKPEYEGSLEVA